MRFFVHSIETQKTKTSNFVLDLSLHWKPVKCVDAEGQKDMVA